MIGTRVAFRGAFGPHEGIVLSRVLLRTPTGAGS
jgi:hypothetical protein